jgi:hypothetical protein
MSFSTFGGLKQAAADFLNRTDLTDQIPDFVKLADATADKVVRSSRMVTTATIPTTANDRNVAVPTDMLEPLYLQSSTDEDYPLEQVDLQELIMLRRARMRTAGPPRVYSIVGRSIELAPTPATSGNLELAYYQTITTLVADGDTNWLLTYEPDLYLYMTLLHAASYLQDDGLFARIRGLVTDEIAAAIGMNKTVQIDSKAAA